MLIYNDLYSIKLNEYTGGKIISKGGVTERVTYLKTFTYDDKLYVIAMNSNKSYNPDIVIYRVRNGVNLNEIARFDRSGINAGGYTANIWEENNKVYFVIAGSYTFNPNFSDDSLVIEFDGNNITLLYTIPSLITRNGIVSVSNGNHLVVAFEKSNQDTYRLLSLTPTGYTIVGSTSGIGNPNFLFFMKGKLWVSTSIGTYDIDTNSYSLITPSKYPAIFIHYQDKILGHIYALSGDITTPTITSFDGFEITSKQFTFQSLGNRAGRSTVFTLGGEPYYISKRASDTTNGRLYKLGY